MTLFSCGGFIFALRLNHSISDAKGLVQLMAAMGELARGLPSPSVVPVWCREVLDAQPIPAPRYPHREYEQVPNTEETIVPFDGMVHRSFFFGQREISTLRSRLPPQLRRASSSFDILTAYVWKIRTLALEPNDPNENFRVLCVVSGHGRFDPPLPSGFYGNAIVFPAAVATAGELCSHPLAYAVELVKRAKSQVSGDYFRSAADYLVMNRRPHYTVERSFAVSDVTRAGFGDVDFGWGKAVYGGPARSGVGAVPGLVTFFVPFVNAGGEKGVVVPVCLPPPAMKRFAGEIQSLLAARQGGNKEVLEGMKVRRDHLTPVSRSPL